jgi:hypothetical protein
VFPVYRSTDGGTSWTKASAITDTVNGYGMRWNPQLYELPAALGNLPAGTVLAAGLSVPADRSSTEILLFASRDRGQSWTFLSSVAKGGRAYVEDPNTPVWEPFLLMHNGKLIVYYSDQRQNAVISQKLVHQASTDALRWGPVVDDVTYPYQSARPGMATVAENNGRWIMTYENCGAPGGGCPVTYKIATDPENFAAATPQQIRLDDGGYPHYQPYVVWTPSGGADGTIAVSFGNMTALAVNTAGGDVNSWRSQASNAPGGYSRSLMVMPDGNTVMTLTGGNHDSNYLNQVQFALDNVAPGVSVGATYTLANAYSGLNLGVSSTTDGAAAVQLTPTAGAAAQQWVLQRKPNGYFTFKNVASGLLLTVRQGSTSDGAIVEQRAAQADPSPQEWAVVHQTDGTFTVTNRKSDMSLDDYHWATTSGSAVVQWTASSGANQRWRLTQAALPDLTAGQYTIQNNLGKYLEIPGGSTASGTQADQWWYANQARHLWRFVSHPAGYGIVNVNSGLALTDTYPASDPKIVQAAARDGDNTQLWQPVADGNQVHLRNVGTGRLVTIAQGSSADLARAVSWTALGTPDQAWTIRRIN